MFEKKKTAQGLQKTDISKITDINGQSILNCTQICIAIFKKNYVQQNGSKSIPYIYSDPPAVQNYEDLVASHPLTEHKKGTENNYGQHWCSIGEIVQGKCTMIILKTAPALVLI